MAAPKSRNNAHGHGCTRCHEWYEDTCDDLVDGVCRQCRKGVGFAILRANRRPKDCCQAHSALATKEQLTKYSLKGAGPWFICTVCARQHPHRDPTRSNA